MRGTFSSPTPTRECVCVWCISIGDLHPPSAAFRMTPVRGCARTSHVCRMPRREKVPRRIQLSDADACVREHLSLTFRKPPPTTEPSSQSHQRWARTGVVSNSMLLIRSVVIGYAHEEAWLTQLSERTGGVFSSALRSDARMCVSLGDLHPLSSAC